MAVIESTLVGLLANFITAGISRTSFVFSRRIQLASRIAKLINGDKNSETNKNEDNSIQVFTKILCHQTGRYDSSVAVLLNEVASDGYAELLVNCALTERHKLNDIKLRFCEQYKDQLLQNDFDPELFFDALLEAVNYVVFKVYQDPEQTLFFSECHSHISKKLDRLLDLRTKSNEDITTVITKDREIAIEQKYCRAMQNANKDISIETNRGSKRVNVEKIFIKSRLRRSSLDNFLNERIEINGFDIDDEIFSYSAFIKSFDRAVIVGDPGGGKSTLCQHLCHEVAKKNLAYNKNKNRNDHDITLSKIPIKIILRFFEKEHERNQTSVLQYIINDVAQKIDEQQNSVKCWIFSMLISGRALILFDGLDEILSIANRRKYVDIVEEFSSKWPSCPILCTSRKVGYLKAPLEDNFAIFELSQFERSEVENYTKKMIKLIDDKNNPQEIHAQLAQDFLEQTDTNATDLRNNPLLLGLMVWLFVSQGRVPKNRASIYTECSILMFDKWDNDRGIRADIPEDFNLMELFTYLASLIFGNRENETGVPSEWIENKLRLYFDNWYEDRGKSARTSKIIKDFVTGRSWVMTDIGASTYAFTHRTFLEYFYSRHVIAEHDSVAKLVKLILRKVVNAEWDVVCHLATQSLCHNNSAKSADFQNRICAEVQKRNLTSDKLTNILFFQSKSMEYLSLSEENSRKLTNHIFEHSFSNCKSSGVIGTVAMEELLRSYVMKRDLICDEVGKILDDKLRSKHDGDILAVIGFLFWKKFIRLVAIQNSETKIYLEYFLSEYIENNRQKLDNHHSDNVLLAAKLTRLFPERTEFYYEKYGDALLFTYYRSDLMSDTPPLLFHLIFDTISTYRFIAYAPSNAWLRDLISNKILYGEQIKIPTDQFYGLVKAYSRNVRQIRLHREILEPIEIGIQFVISTEIEYANTQRGTSSYREKPALRKFRRRRFYSFSKMGVDMQYVEDNYVAWLEGDQSLIDIISETAP